MGIVSSKIGFMMADAGGNPGSDPDTLAQTNTTPPGGSTKPPATMVPSQDLPPTPATPDNTPPPAGTATTSTASTPTAPTGGNTPSAPAPSLPPQAPPPAGPNIGTPSINSGTAVLRNVNAGTETTGGQLSTLMQSDNPIIAQARARAEQMANERGLQNSSMAAGSAEEAAVNAMLPVAQSNAGAFERSAMANQDVQNQFEAMGKQFEQQTGQQERQIAATHADVGAQVAAQMADAAARVSLGNAQIASSERMSTAQINASTHIAQLDADTRTNLEARQIAANSGMFDREAALRRELNTQGLQQTTQTNYTAQINAILTDPNLDATSRQNALNTLNAVYAGSPFLPPGITINVGAPPPGGGTGSGGGGGGGGGGSGGGSGG